MLCVAFAWFGVGVIALYRCGAALVAERRYKLKVCSLPPDGLGTSKRSCGSGWIGTTLLQILN